MADLGESLDRDTRAMERLADAFERIATVFEKRFAKDHPEKVAKVAELIETDHKQREQELSDKADKQWFEETAEALPASRFQERADKQQTSQREGNLPTKEKVPSKRRPT